ncbi:hypothetical protein E2C01_084365 [Portunus trituberculatus]|uniref:Uncharacterized protein n=1 Tax=Portunus trituberculatus TaxID=210409 RepID=A0A5B7J418_PORTR|nr:hypothetical protein [Portunus trituberculatus]
MRANIEEVNTTVTLKSTTITTTNTTTTTTNTTTTILEPGKFTVPVSVLPGRPSRKRTKKQDGGKKRKHVLKM